MQVNITNCLNIQIILIAHKFFQCYPRIVRKQNTLSINFKRGLIYVEKKYLTAKEAAIYTGISHSHLAKLRTSGKGCQFVRIGNGPTKALIRYRKKDLDEWLAGNTVRTNGGQ